MAGKEGLKGIIVPEPNAREAAVVDNVQVRPASGLAGAAGFLAGAQDLPLQQFDRESLLSKPGTMGADLTDVKGQAMAKRALEIAAGGGHNLLFIGPPGSGKTMLARRIVSILPSMSLKESMETTRIHSIAGLLAPHTALITERPFRAPHHHISNAGLIGGGLPPRPGEISLAHNGVLFLDELTEFRRPVLEQLRQPLEERFLTVARSGVSVRYPASILFVGAMNPCPCGYLGATDHACSCSEVQMKRYRNRLSGPLLDRIDLQVEVARVPYRDITLPSPHDTASAGVRRKVFKARAIQEKRFNGSRAKCNAQMTPKQTLQACALDPEGQRFLEAAFERFGLSARAYHRVLKVSRTIADLNHDERIRRTHLAEAIQYRILDRGRELYST